MKNIAFIINPISLLSARWISVLPRLIPPLCPLARRRRAYLPPHGISPNRANRRPLIPNRVSLSIRCSLRSRLLSNIGLSFNKVFGSLRSCVTLYCTCILLVLSAAHLAPFYSLIFSLFFFGKYCIFLIPRPLIRGYYLRCWNDFCR